MWMSLQEGSICPVFLIIVIRILLILISYSHILPRDIKFPTTYPWENVRTFQEVEIRFQPASRRRIGFKEEMGSLDLRKALQRKEMFSCIHIKMRRDTHTLTSVFPFQRLKDVHWICICQRKWQNFQDIWTYQFMDKVMLYLSWREIGLLLWTKIVGIHFGDHIECVDLSCSRWNMNSWLLSNLLIQLLYSHTVTL